MLKLLQVLFVWNGGLEILPPEREKGILPLSVRIKLPALKNLHTVMLLQCWPLVNFGRELIFELCSIFIHRAMS
jgi:hypothetical protein